MPLFLCLSYLTHKLSLLSSQCHVSNNQKLTANGSQASNDRYGHFKFHIHTQ